MKTFDTQWRLGLERMVPLLAALGNPEEGMRIIQVAGTNGKGSTAYLTAGLLSILATGAVGLFTSPHLERLTERFQLVMEGIPQEINNEALAVALDRVSAAALKIPPAFGPLTEFEAWTAAAVLLFAEAKVKFAVFEVGLGGRLDATTALPAEAAVITPISFDHQDRLGVDLASIAGEKAAIIRRGQQVVVADQDAEALKVITDWARRQQARITSVCDRYGILEYNSGGTKFQWFDRTLRPFQFRLGLLGEQQVMNAAAALCTMELIWGAEFVSDSNIPLIDHFLSSARWPGRFEYLMTNRQPILLDVGHNPQAVKSLLANLNRYFPTTPKWGLYATLRDKDYRSVAALLNQYSFNGFVLTNPWSERALPASDLAAFFSDKGRVFVNTDLGEALKQGLARAGQDEALLCVFGSFFLVGPVRTMLEESMTP